MSVRVRAVSSERRSAEASRAGTTRIDNASFEALVAACQVLVETVMRVDRLADEEVYAGPARGAFRAQIERSLFPQ
jgi:hypothetical protein